LTKKGEQKFKEIKPATDRWMFDTGNWSPVTCHLLLTAGYWSPVGTESDPTLPLNPKSQIPNPQSKVSAISLLYARPYALCLIIPKSEI